MTIRPDPMPAIQAAATVRLGNTTGLRDAPAWLLDAVESYPRTRTQCRGPDVRQVTGTTAIAKGRVNGLDDTGLARTNLAPTGQR